MTSIEKAKENLIGRFWTRRQEMEEEIESLDYTIIWNGADEIIVTDDMDEDLQEITLTIGRANRTMWVSEVK